MLVGVLVGSGYLHALKLVSLVGVSLLVRAGWCPGWKWLPACLETRVPGSCVLGWCGYLHALNLVSLVGVSLLVRVVRAGWCALLVGSGYLHALNLVSLVGVPCWFVSWLEVITCMP